MVITDCTKDDHVQQKQVNILLIEDNSTDTLLVQSHIEKFTNFRLHAVETLSQAIESLNSQSFDVILLDLNLPDALGLEGLIKLRHHVQRIPIVVLTGVNNGELGIMALQRGAQDYLIKGADTHRLSNAIRYAIERIPVQDPESSPVSDLYFDTNRMSKHLIPKSFIGNSPKAKQYNILTERELQVLKLLGKGFNNQEIADRLLVSINTVKTHIASILHKLSVSDRTKAIIEAQRQGLI